MFSVDLREILGSPVRMLYMTNDWFDLYRSNYIKIIFYTETQEMYVITTTCHILLPVNRFCISSYAKQHLI